VLDGAIKASHNEFRLQFILRRSTNRQSLIANHQSLPLEGWAMKEKWLNRIAVVGFVIVLGLWVWWLFRPQPMPFVLRARWKVQGIVMSDIAFSPKGDWLAALVSTSQQGQPTLTVQLWQVPKTQNKTKGVLRQPAS
jgi:hypothetical protein